MSAVDLSAINGFLPCVTPQAWVAWALDNPQLLLVDHANCEKKAASTALNLMYRYVEHPRLLHKLSRLAREELRHFEQVLGLLQKRNIDYPQLSASRYAGELRKQVRGNEPGRLVDTLLVGALIEARSCERFAALIPVLDDELAAFYGSLLKSEARHFQDYLALASALAPETEVTARLAVLRAREAELICGHDTEFRFHSGVPHT
ncbi:tRNA-(ms[2]io[6]A)-hydroxylase [Kineobactrum sediminis]|uniref:tRNA-(Ms[2]io[6]A)-hydroxylase n=1 Tax=Kineobactrum sediminis TaxID=1905677 RepID=A0A2N5Y1M0_9GAMM|nr:tRNA isopentenyl-2-thiomethyl-A-37 hydroxylase MiaE [Kineobactrum sediminis]PLW82295.1 tRNA-(ms[2]io[6]A)-hydroxylase [Kineobactrum sediminis]